MSNNTLIVRGNNCMYIDMSRFGKTLGYHTCPMCVISLMLIALISVPKVGVVTDTAVETKDNECSIKIKVE